MRPRVALVKQVIQPLVHPKGEGTLWEFHPWWMEPNRRMDSGRVLQNVEFPKGTGLAVMSYGGSPRKIFELTAPIRRQAVANKLPWQFGIETIPGQGVPHFGGSKAGQIPSVLADAVRIIRTEDPLAFGLFGGAYFHAKGPSEGHQVVIGLSGREKVEEKQPEVKPSPAFGVKQGKAAVFTGQRIVLDLNLSEGELTGGPWVAVLFTKIKQDLSYIQPTADGGAAFPVRLADKDDGSNGSVQLNAHPNRPFDAPAVEKITVVLLPKREFELALAAYNLQANNPLTAAGAMGAFIRSAGKTVRIVDLDRGGKAAVRSGGLEEVQITSLRGLLSEMDESFPDPIPAGITHAFLLDKQAVDQRSAAPEPLTVDLYTHSSVSAGALQVLPSSWRLGNVRMISEDVPEWAAAAMEEASGAANAGRNVVVALDSHRRQGLTLPHALVLLLDPATQDKLDRNVLAAYLGQRKALFNFILDLTSGSVVIVPIAGREYYAVLATAA